MQKLRLFAAVALTGTLVACSGEETETGEASGIDCRPLEKVEKVVYAQPTSMSLGVYYQTAAGGYFEDENIEIDFQQVQSGQDIAALLGAGRLDAIGSGIGAGHFATIDAGVGIEQVLTMGATPRGEIDELGAAFFVRTELLESGDVSRLADLEGRKVSYPGGLGTAASWYVGTMLASDGLDVRDTEHVPLAYQEMNAAFESGAIDAAFVSAPFKEVVLGDGYARPFGDQNLIMGHAVGGTFLGPNLLKDRPQVGCAFIRAELRAIRDRLADPDYNDNPDVVAGFVEAGEFPEDVVRSTPEYFYPEDGAQNPDTLMEMQDFFIKVGVLELDEPVDADEIINDELRQAALESIDD